MKNIIQYSDSKKLIALKIIKDLNLIKLWNNYGNPYIVGAVAYNLILSNDIDMEIYCEELKIKDGFTILSSCAVNKSVISAKFRNCLNERDKALYWQLRYKYKDEIWKIDMWSAPKNYELPKSIDIVHSMNNLLSPTLRKIILVLKEKIINDNSFTCPSIKLYEAVISYNVSSIEQLKKWLQDQDLNELTYWKPN